MSVGPTEILLVALVFFLFFGVGRIGEVGKGLGEGIRNFKRGISGDSDDRETPQKSTSAPQIVEPSDASRESDAAAANKSQSGKTSDAKQDEHRS